MDEYIVYSSRLIPSKFKGELSNVIYTYIADDSQIGWHYTITNERNNAYVFDELELKHAEFIADSWGMKIEKING